MASLDPASGILGHKNASHLLRRISFGPTIDEINTFAAMTVEQAVDAILQPSAEPEPPIDPATSDTWIGAPRSGDFNENEYKTFLLGWWMEQMRKSGVSIVEKMVYYLHTHFTTIQSRVPHSEALYYQLALFRYYALGNIRELSKKICLDNAMLRNLDGHINVEGNPNENFAREFFELYTIGKGTQTGPGDYTNYTEEDIQEAAKLLSGFGYDDTFSNLDPDCNIPLGVVKGDGNSASQHDAATKTFSAAFQGTSLGPQEVINGKATVEAVMQELSDFVDMIFAQEATAKYICSRLYRFFVYYKTEEAEDVIDGMAETLRNNDYELEPVLRQLLLSQHFYDQDDAVERDDHFGAIIKSPLELLLHTVRFFEMPVPDNPRDLYGFYSELMGMMSLQGQDFYEPYDVAGYDAYHQAPAYNRSWISSNYLASRYQFIVDFIGGVANEEMVLSKIDIVRFIDTHVTDPTDPDQIVALLTDYLFPQSTPAERFDYFKNVALLDNLSEMNWASEWNNYKSTGDDSAVRVQLEVLLTAVIQSPEYQLC